MAQSKNTKELKVFDEKEMLDTAIKWWGGG